MNISELSVKRPILIIVFFTAIILLGVFGFTSLKYELLPKINTPFITIVSIYEGASPAEIENSITKNLEDAVSGVSKVKRVTSRSNEGYAVLSIEFLQNTDIDQALQEVQRFVNQAVSKFPQGAKMPSIDKYSLSDLPILRIATTSSMDDEAFFEVLKSQIKPRLSQLEGVGRIQLIGGTEKEVKILLDEQKLRNYQVPILAVVQALQKSNLEFPLGKVNDNDAQFNIRLNGKFSEFKTLQELDIAVLPDGSKLKLKEVAKIEGDFKDERTITRLNQKSSVGIILQKQSNANAVDVSERVRNELKEIEKDYKSDNLSFEIAADSSEFTLKATETVFFDLLFAILLVALVMLVFLHSIRNAIIIMVSIPTSLVFSFIGMWMMDFSLNLMTLLAMSLVIGILVDDSIVILENIYQHLEKGKDRITATLDGRRQIGFSAISITLVIVVVFLPVAFVPGITGGIVKEFALVVVISTLASLLVCFTLTPMLSSRFAKLEHYTRQTLGGRIIIFIESQINNLNGFYLKTLKEGLKRRWLIYTLSFGSLAGSVLLLLYGFIGGEFLPTADKGEISVIVETPAGTKFSETDRLAQKLENEISMLPEVKRIFTTVGLSNDSFFGEVIGDNQIEFSILLVDKGQRSKSVTDMSQVVKSLILRKPGTKVKVSPVGLLGAEEIPVQVLISGSDRDKVIGYAKELKRAASSIEGTYDVRLSVLDKKQELNIKIDRDRMASLGLDLESVSMTMNVALSGYADLKFRENNTEFPIRIQLEKDDRRHTSQVENISFTNNQGEMVYLKQFATIQNIASENALERRDKNASVILFSKALGKSVSEVGAGIQSYVLKNPPPSGVRVSYEGDLERADDSFLYLGLALLAGIIFVYLIMVALYNSFLYPFVVLFSIPVALTGALIALAVTMKSLNVFSIFGTIMMLGLVAKNAILLVDKTNELKQNNHNTLYSLLNSGKTRLRPILMTTLSMVIGMLPLALQQGASAEYISAMAWVLIGGLTSSMIFTLFVVPAIYLDLERLKVKINRLLSISSNLNTESIVSSTQRPNQSSNSNMTKKRDRKNLGGLSIALLLVLLAQSLSIRTNAQHISLSLKDAESRVMSDNPEINIQKQNISKAKWTIAEARSLYLPSISFSSTFYHHFNAPKFFLPTSLLIPEANPNDFMAINATDKNVYQNDFLLVQPLIQFENGPILANSKLNLENANLQTRITESQRVADVRKAYYDALWAKAQGAYLDEIIKRQLQLLGETRLQMKQGFLTESDTLMVFVQVENIKPQLVKVNNAYSLAEKQLKLLLNLSSTDTLALTDSLVFKPEILENTDPQNRPDLQQLNLLVKMQDNQLKLEKAKMLPNLQLIAQHSISTQYKNFNYNDYNWINSNFVGLQFSIPIFTGMRNSSRIQQAIIERKQAEETYQYSIKQADLEIKTYNTTLNELSQQIVSQRMLEKSAQRLYRLVHSRWQQGLVKQGELLDAELALQQATLNKIGLIYQYLLVESELKRVRGV